MVLASEAYLREEARKQASATVHLALQTVALDVFDDLGCVYHQAPHVEDAPGSGCDCSIEWDRNAWMAHGVYRGLYLALDLEGLMAELVRTADWWPTGDEEAPCSECMAPPYSRCLREAGDDPFADWHDAERQAGLIQLQERVRRERARWAGEGQRSLFSFS
jgi:hypothetical protein